VPPAPDATILDIINASPDLSRVRDLIDFSGFGPELDDADPRTFFAPSNAAIDTLERSPGGAAILADRDDTFALLADQLVLGALDESAVFGESSLETSGGNEVDVDDRANPPKVGGAEIIVPDVDAANGYLHVVDQVFQTN
jgi:uncharacterized surface protein with fasciclin (FAS1) repeats